MATRFLIFCAPVTPQTASALSMNLVQAFNDVSVSDVTIAFASTGGEVHSGVFLHGLLRAAPKPVTMHAIGTVASIGITVFLGAEIRRATNGCLFFFHPMTTGVANGTANRITSDAASAMLEADEARLGALWREQTRLGDEAVQSLFKADCMKSAEWGRENGLVAEIADLVMPANAGLIAVAV